MTSTSGEDNLTYSTLEVDERPKPDLANQKIVVEEHVGLEPYHPEYSQYEGNNGADLEVYQPGWTDKDGGKILAVAEENDDKEVVNSQEGSDVSQEEKGSDSKRQTRKRITFYTFLALIGCLAAVALVVGLVVGLRHSNSSHNVPPSATTTSIAVSSPSSSLSSSTTASAASSTTASSPAASSTSSTNGTFGAEISNCDKSSTNFFLGAPSGACSATNTTGGFEVTDLQSSCTVTVYTDPYCSLNATAARVDHCLDNFSSFSVDTCN